MFLRMPPNPIANIPVVVEIPVSLRSIDVTPEAAIASL